MVKSCNSIGIHISEADALFGIEGDSAQSHNDCEEEPDAGAVPSSPESESPVRPFGGGVSAGHAVEGCARNGHSL